MSVRLQTRGIRKDTASHPNTDDIPHYLDRENPLRHTQSNRVAVGWQTAVAAMPLFADMQVCPTVPTR